MCVFITMVLCPMVKLSAGLFFLLTFTFEQFTISLPSSQSSIDRFRLFLDSTLQHSRMLPTTVFLQRGQIHSSNSRPPLFAEFIQARMTQGLSVPLPRHQETARTCSFGKLPTSKSIMPSLSVTLGHRPRPSDFLSFL